MKENIIIPFTLVGALIIGIYFGLLEPSINEWMALGAQKKETTLKLIDLRKNYNPETNSQAKNTNSRNTTYLLDYLDALILKSDINKLTGYQPVSVQGAKGVPSYQIRFSANANALLKFMYLSEETVPRLAVNSCRASSIAGGSYSGMRRLECQLTVSLISKGNETKINIADLSGFKAINRDPFADVLKAEPRQEKMKELDVPDVPGWTLTAVMSEGAVDTLLFKKENGGEKYAVNLKKSGNISLTWIKDQVELRSKEAKILWSMGETKAEDTLPKELVESIKSGDKGQSVSDKSPEVKGIVSPEEELNKIGSGESPLDQIRNMRRMPRRR